MRDLNHLLFLIDRANKALFNPFGAKCALFLVENQFKEVELGYYK